MISHRSVLYCIAGQARMLRQGEAPLRQLAPSDTFLSWLPLCHVMVRLTLQILPVKLNWHKTFVSRASSLQTFSSCISAFVRSIHLCPIYLRKTVRIVSSCLPPTTRSKYMGFFCGCPAAHDNLTAHWMQDMVTEEVVLYFGFKIGYWSG